MDAAEWERLVNAQRAGGLLSMSPNDRLALLQGSLKAYLMSVSDTERTLTSTGGGSAHIFEQYSKDGELYALLSAREQSSTNVTTDWPDMAFLQDGSSEKKLFVNLRSDGVSIDDWTKTGIAWRCVHQDSASIPISFAEREYFRRVVDTFLAGAAVRSATFAGRDAVAFDVPNGDQTTSTAWLDTRTLFPIGFQYPATVSSGRTVGPPAEVRINGVNVAHEIQRPAEICG